MNSQPARDPHPCIPQGLPWRGWQVWGNHSIVEDTKKAAMAKVKEAKPCECEECKRG